MDNYNYYSDHRVQAQNEDVIYDVNKKTVTYKNIPVGDDETEDITFPGMVVVCPTCEGKGSHVNPSIDAGGLTGADFEEDPEFLEDYYIHGLYDVSCYQCNGNKVIVEIDEKRADPEKLKIVHGHIIDEMAARAEYLAEVRMGA